MSSSNTDLDEVPLSPSVTASDGYATATYRQNSSPSSSSFASARSLHESEQHDNVATNPSASTTSSTTRTNRLIRLPKGGGQRLRAGLSKVGTTLQKFNLGKLIDEMEQDQQLADHLEIINRDIQEETGRKELVREAIARCQDDMEQHLQEFLQQHPSATYEEWIQDLHPENVSHGSLLEDLTHLDLRFYVPESDHRLLWNQMVQDENRHVPPRTYYYNDPSTNKDSSNHADGDEPSLPRDLLDD